MSETARAETGPMKFGDDWTGVFIRGDNAMGYALALKTMLDGHLDAFMKPVVVGLLATLQNADERSTHLSDTQLMKPFDDACATTGVDPSSDRRL